jgi:hypothetical protein
MWKKLQPIWHDPVWSKVIAVGIVSLSGAVWASVHFNWWPRLLNTYSIPAWVLLIIALTFLGFVFLLWKQPQFGEAEIAKVAVNIIPVDKGKTLTYPLKCYVQLRNNSAKCADIRLLEYTPNTVTLKAFVLEALQLRMRDWTPSDHGLDRLAVLPHQLFRVWIGVDENKFNADQLERLSGKIGTLVFLVNGKRVNIDL